jgi:predicted nucleic acid-binding protein
VIHVVIDTGPLVAFLNRRDQHHLWIRGVLDTVLPPLFTCESVLSEACFLLSDDGRDAVLELVHRGIVRCEFSASAEVQAVRALMRRFASVPMSFADACLVRMTEMVNRPLVLTVDGDFRLYRRNRRQAIPTLMPAGSS